MPRPPPTASTPGLLCGVDEAGRGPLAGSVFAAAVVLDPGKPRIKGLADSKLLTAQVRERLCERIKGRALAWSVACASVEEIDRINILRASLHRSLACGHDARVVDALQPYLENAKSHAAPAAHRPDPGAAVRR